MSITKKVLSVMTKKSTRLILLLMAILLLIIIVVLAIPSKDSEFTTISKSSLEKIVDIEDLQTLDYTYNAVAKIKTDNGKDYKYYVAYEGKVVAGVNFSEIDIIVYEEQKKVTVTLPEATIQSYEVNAGTMDYIFVKDKYETETVSAEAYNKCLEDLKIRVESEDTMLKLAKDNAISTIKALVEPWIAQIDNEYIIEVK